MVNTQSQTRPDRHPSRLRRWSARIGSLALAGLSIAHLVINSIGFAREPGAGWPLFLVFGIGLSVVAAAIALLAWREADRGRGGPWVRVLLGIAGALCCVGIVNLLRGDYPELILSPIGPGLWSLIGGPALVLAALLPRRRPRADFC